MPVRMSGLISGLDTDRLIQGIVDAQKLRNKRVSDKKDLLTWKQEKWKELNTKLFKLYSEELSQLRLQGNYLAKKTSVANDKIASIVGDNGAPSGTHSLEVKELASAKFLTGDKILKDSNDKDVSVDTKLVDLGIADQSLINFEVKGKKYTLEVDKNTTLNDFINKAKSAGLNANFDTVQKRLFVSSKESGVDNSFEITTTFSGSTSLKRDIKDKVGYSSLGAEDRKKVDDAINVLSSNNSTESDINTAKSILESYTGKKLDKELEAEVDHKIREEVLLNKTSIEDFEKDKIKAEVMQREIVLLQEEARKAGKSQEEIADIKEENLSDEDRARIQALQDDEISKSEKRINEAVEKEVANAIKAEKEKDVNENRYVTYPAEQANVDRRTVLIQEIGNLANDYQAESSIPESTVSGVLENLGLGAGAVVVDAKDTKFVLNGAEMTSSSNQFKVNGLSITLKDVGKTTATVSSDVEGIYDNIKKFVNKYNEILKEMNDLYDAIPAKGLNPLSEEEKAMMSESQIEKWESKIKDSVLRRDETLGSLTDAMRNALNISIEIDGKKYSLASLGIVTSSDYNEKGLLHIRGDKDFPQYSSEENVLMKLLETDPDKVTQIMSKATSSLYNKMNDKMKPISNIRSAFTFYNDKTMTKQLDSYSKEVKKLEKKLTELENKYYKQFAAMETAMAKLQSQSNALAGMLGLNNNNK